MQEGREDRKSEPWSPSTIKHLNAAKGSPKIVCCTGECCALLICPETLTAEPAGPELCTGTALLSTEAAGLSRTCMAEVAPLAEQVQPEFQPAAGYLGPRCAAGMRDLDLAKKCL